MATKNNPVKPRLDYIFKNFPPVVGHLVTLAWLEAVGQDGVAMRLGGLLDRARSRPDDAEIRLWSKDAVAAAIEQGAPSSTPYDRYLPWLAKAINDRFKPVLKRVRSELKNAPEAKWAEARGEPARHPGRENLQFDLLDLLVFSPLTPYTTYGVMLHADTVTRIELAYADVRKLYHSLRAITQWADAERVDLPSYSLPLIFEESEAWGEHHRYGQDATQGEVVYEFADGWTVQKLSSEEELEAEGEIMQHCVGTYFPLEDEVEIFSLRDPQGRPHATMEYVGMEKVEQLRGKQNDDPKWEYFKRMVEFRGRGLKSKGKPVADVSFDSLPASTRQLKSKLLAAYLIEGDPPSSTLLVYSDGSLVTLVDLENFVLYVSDQCHHDVWSEDRNANNADAVERCVVATLSDTKPVDIEDSHHQGLAGLADADEWLQWEVWVRSGISDLYSKDEMLKQFGRFTHKQNSELRQLASAPRSRAAANPGRRKRSTKMSVANPMASLKRKLMR